MFSKELLRIEGHLGVFNGKRKGFKELCIEKAPFPSQWRYFTWKKLSFPRKVLDSRGKRRFFRVKEAISTENGYFSSYLHGKGAFLHVKWLFYAGKPPF